jgi:hypothetical protein
VSAEFIASPKAVRQSAENMPVFIARPGGERKGALAESLTIAIYR